MNSSMKIRLSEPLDSHPLFQRVLDTIILEKLSDRKKQDCPSFAWSGSVLWFTTSDILEATSEQDNSIHSFLIYVLLSFLKIVFVM